jgi:hypothetical protein
MKQVIKQWLEDNTHVVKAHDGTFRITLPAKFEFAIGETASAKDSDYAKTIDKFASDLAAHIENSRSGH